MLPARHRKLLVHFLPGLVRIVLSHFTGQRGCVGAKVLLDDDTVLVDHECHHSRSAILGGISQECEALGHLATDQVVLCSARSIPALRCQYFVVVPVKRDRISASVLLVARRSCARDQRSDRARGLSFSGFPIQPVLFAGIAQDLLREQTRTLAIVRIAGGLSLGVCPIFENFDREQFVSTYSSEE